MHAIEKLDEIFKFDKSKEYNIYIDKVTGLLNMIAFQKILKEVAFSSIKDYIEKNKNCSR